MRGVPEDFDDGELSGCGPPAGGALEDDWDDARGSWEPDDGFDPISGG